MHKNSLHNSRKSKWNATNHNCEPWNHWNTWYIREMCGKGGWKMPVWRSNILDSENKTKLHLDQQNCFLLHFILLLWNVIEPQDAARNINLRWSTLWGNSKALFCTALHGLQDKKHMYNCAYGCKPVDGSHNKRILTGWIFSWTYTRNTLTGILKHARCL